MTWFDFEGHKVFYERQGAGEPIVFLPNATLDGKLWEFQAGHFKATHDVLVVDLPGFARSDRITPSLELWVRWLLRFVDDLGLAPVALVGNCMGSLTALHYAAANPDKVSALVLIHTLDNDVGTAGPMGGGGGLLDHTWARPALEWLVRHQFAWTWEKHPGPFDKAATVYPSSQFGTIAEPRQEEYTRHAFELFAEVETRLNLVRLAYTGDTCVPPSAELVDRLPPVCWIWGDANKLLPYEVGKRQLDVLHPAEVHVLPGRVYAVAWEAPHEVNRIIETSSTATRRGPTRRQVDMRSHMLKYHVGVPLAVIAALLVVGFPAASAITAGIAGCLSMVLMMFTGHGHGHRRHADQHASHAGGASPPEG